MMSDNRKRILQMLADGKITPDDADRLIAALGEGVSDEQPVYARAVAMTVVSEGRDGDVEIELAETENRTNDHAHVIETEIEETIEEYQDDGDAPRGRDDVFEVGEFPHLEVQNINGRIEVNKGNDGEIRVRASFRNAPRVDYQAVQDGDTIRVFVKKRGSGLSLFRSPGVRLEITAPASTTVDLTTSNGRVEMREIEGPGPVRTTNGRVVLERMKGDHDVTTSNGRIEINGMEGSGGLRTSNGAIDIKNAIGDFSARTSNGSIHFDGELSNRAKNSMETSNGSVKVRLRGKPSLRINAQTSNGRVKTDLPIQATSSGRSSLEGVIGDGDGELVVRTSNGSVTIE